MKPFLITVGLVATGLAILGVILPGLPTTPFLLVALWAFARSSARFHAWLYRIPILQSALREAERFEQHRTMRRGVKHFALAMVLTSLTVSIYAFTATRPWVVGFVVVMSAIAVLVLILVPTDTSPND